MGIAHHFDSELQTDHLFNTYVLSIHIHLFDFSILIIINPSCDMNEYMEGGGKALWK